VDSTGACMTRMCASSLCGIVESVAQHVVSAAEQAPWCAPQSISLFAGVVCAGWVECANGFCVLSGVQPLEGPLSGPYNERLSASQVAAATAAAAAAAGGAGGEEDEEDIGAVSANNWVRSHSLRCSGAAG